MRLAAICGVLLILTACNTRSRHTSGRKMIVLGVDGMDPGFLDKHWADLPNLRQLRDNGSFQRLATTVPPQSPVAWSTVTTGLDPGGHGIFDFVHRVPATRMPVSSMAETLPATRTLAVGPYVIPLRGGAVRNLRSGKSFWQTLSAQGVPVSLIRMPVNFPPDQCEAESLSGMGTPDLEGSFGTFTFFTNDPAEGRETVSGGRIVRIALQNGQTTLRVRGPENTLRKDHAIAFSDLTLFVDPASPAIRIDSPSQRIVLREGDWSEWIHLEFPLMPWVKARGMVRVYLQKAHPYLRLYVSPVNLDPESPELPISTPATFSRTLARQVGPFYTQGIAEESSAYRAGIFNKEEYLAQSKRVLDDSLKLFRQQLAQFSDGLFFYYFSSIDQGSHMLWEKHEGDLLRIYRDIDNAIGEAARKAGTDTPLLILSDHGFARFDRAVHLNAWLRQEGFLTLTDPFRAGDDELFAHVDWSKTKAYALGLNSIYLNLQSREPNGTVPPSEKQVVLDQISQRLLRFKDPSNNRAVVVKLYQPETAFRGRNTTAAPDLFVGYDAGYRASWQTALGAVPRELLEDNTSSWIGDHCIASHLVPGVLLSNRKLRSGNPQLYDIPATILNYFGIARSPEMPGGTVLE